MFSNANAFTIESGMKAKGRSALPDIPAPVSYLVVVSLSLCYANSYDGTFAFDDSEAIVNNDDVQSTPLWDVFKNDFWGTKLSHKQSHKSYRPLTILTYRLQYWIRQGLVPQDFHIVNVILHTLVCILLLPVFNVLLGSKGKNIGFYAATLFAVHPVHAEAVSSIVGRAELLCALFTWISILLYNHSVHSRTILYQSLYMTGCITCIAIAMLCKETGVTAIAICAMFDALVVNELYPVDLFNLVRFKYSFMQLMKFVKAKRQLLVRLGLLFLSMVILLAARFSVMGFKTPTFQSVDNPASFMNDIFLRGLNYSYIYCLNVWLLICPEWLCFDWSMGCVPLITTIEYRLFAIVTFWLILSLFVRYLVTPARDCSLRYSTVGLTLLIVPFLPASNLFFSVGFVLAERILYIPSVGYCLLIVIGLEKLYRRLPSRYLILSYAFLILLFFSRSWIRSDQWRNETFLFRSALNVCPLNAKVHYNIAKNAADAGNISLAQYEYEEALRLNPKYAQAMNNLGNLLKDRGRYSEAEMLFKQAVELQEDFATAWMNLGIVLSALKKFDKSEKSYLIALAHRSKYPDCHYNLGVLYLEMKDYKKALDAWRTAIKQKNSHRRAWTNMILLLDNLDMRQDALIAAAQALKFLPGDASIYFNTANILGKEGQFLEAEIYFKKAISRNPTDAMFYTNLGVLYHRWNKVKEAENMYQKALSIKPELHSARDNLKKLHSLKSSIR